MIEVKFYKMRSAFFPKAVDRLVMYLMGNGATLDNDIKLKADKKFDKKMVYAYIDACVDGVVWCFVDKDETIFYRLAEEKGAKGLIVLLDERTGRQMAAIRFTQIDPNKPMYVTLFEVDGITEYVTNDNGSGLIEDRPKRTYRQTIRRDAFSETVINGENYGVLPFVPLYTNNLKRSRLTVALKETIDARDAIYSDLIDSIVHTEGLYSIIKNYGGSDLNQALKEILEHRLLPIDGTDAMADIKAIEASFQGKLATMEQCEKDMYALFMLPEANVSRAVTATEIFSARDEFDTATDLLEFAVADAIEEIFLVKGIDIGTLPNYKRRTTINDNAMVQNIATQLSGGWIDEEEAINLDPTIPTEDKDALLERLKLRDAELDNMRFPPDGGAGQDTGV